MWATYSIHKAVTLLTAKVFVQIRQGVMPSYSHHETGILVPVEQRVLSTFRLRILHIRPSIHESLMGLDGRELASNGSVHILHDFKVRWEENVEVSLLYLHIISMSHRMIEGQKLTRGVETGIIRLLYLVCTTGPFTPTTASGKV